MKKVLTVFLLAVLSYGCGVVPKELSQSPADVEAQQPEPEDPVIKSSSSPKNFSDSAVRQKLMVAYNDWQGVPYLLGGSSFDRGVDCSSFMQIVFEDHFQILLPRNTTDQLRQGIEIRRSDIQPGDLVFFKTSRKLWHVGVAMDDLNFLHASTSEGVTISKLDEPYWSRRFHSARRIL